MSEALLNELLGSEVVRYYPALAKHVGGAATALYLSQLLYWNFNAKMQVRLEKKEGWFYISKRDMKEQTGLSEREQDRARVQLLKLKIIEISYKGLSPKTTHFKINISKLEDIVITHSPRNVPTSGRETSPLITAKRGDFNTETIIDYKENTITASGKESEAVIDSQLPELPEETPIPVNGNGNSIKELTEKEKPKATAVKTPTQQQAMLEALSIATGVDYKIRGNCGRLGKTAAELITAGYKPQHVVEKYIGTGSWWYQLDWRGKKGDKPKLANIAETIGNACGGNGAAGSGNSYIKQFVDGGFE